MKSTQKLSDEIERCSIELNRLKSSHVSLESFFAGESNRKTLIISTGDISDVDGFFALAEYAKTGADVIFIMNYPAYIQKTTKTSQECSLGLGYTYDARTYIQKSNENILSKINNENDEKYVAYKNLLNTYSSIHTNWNIIMKEAFTDLAFHLASKCWKEAGGHTDKFFFCVGGVNAVNPFQHTALKNELFVYGQIARDMRQLRTYDEGSIVNHEGSISPKGVKDFVLQYEKIYMDFNGSMAFFDNEWVDTLTVISKDKRLKGVYVMGGVFSNAKPMTIPRVPNVLNRLSCATMNQLYHPSNAHRLFGLLKANSVWVIVICNNQVEETVVTENQNKVDKWLDFLNSNSIHSDFLRELSNTYYNSIYNLPTSVPRKPFDFYVAKAISHSIAENKAEITYTKRLFFNSYVGAFFIGNSTQIYSDVTKQYETFTEQKIEDTPEQNKAFVKNAYEKETELIKRLEFMDMSIIMLDFSMDKVSFKLNIKK